MHGSGTFIDKRLDVAANPIAMKTKLGESRGTPDKRDRQTRGPALLSAITACAGSAGKQL